MEMEEMREEIERLTAENARLKATRAAIYKMYIESQGKTSSRFSRQRVFEALQLSADADRDKKEPAPKIGCGRKPKKPDDAAPDAPAEEVKAEPDEVKADP